MMPDQEPHDFMIDEKTQREHHIVVSDIVRKLEEISLV